MKSLYAPIEPFAVHKLAVGHGHHVCVEECGNPQGLPVLFLHGGPGAGCKLHHRGFFDPARYRAVLLDQRGAGRSTPHGGLQHNTTTHLLEDLEAVRKKLGIERWLLFGGSWGAALALLYAQKHPKRVLGLVLRGSFLARPSDLDWFLGAGAGRIYP
ncbi:alpha/beta fold hydrolase, partial [Methylogaea oryzae]